MKPHYSPLLCSIKRAKTTFALGVVTAAFTSPISAQTTWQGDVSTNWNTTGNWSTNALPTTSVNVIFDNTATSTSVTLSADGNAGNITFSANAPTFSIGGGFQLWTGSSFVLTNNSNSNQDLTGISLLRPNSASNTTIGYVQNTAATLKLPKILGSSSTANLNTRQVFSGDVNGTIEVAGLDDRSLSSNTTSVLLNGPVTVKILGDGNFTGARYSTGAAVTLRDGVVSVGSVANSGTISPLGSGGSIDFGDASATSATGTLRFTGAGTGSTNRQFRIYGTSTGVFDVTEATGNLELTTGVSQNTGSGGKLTKSGDGTLTLSATSGYTGATTVSKGRLVVNGNISTSSLTTVNHGASLGGNGTVGAATVNGFHDAGSTTIGVQSFSGNLAYGATSIFEWDLAGSVTGSRNTNYDGVNVGSSLTGSSGAKFRVNLNSGTFGDTFWDINRTWNDIFLAEVNGSGSALNIQNVFSAIEWYEGATNMTSLTDSQGYFSLSGSSLTWTAVPEPSTSVLAGLLLTVGLLRRRRERDMGDSI